jgi:hypothetical protein
MRCPSVDYKKMIPLVLTGFARLAILWADLVREGEK